MKLEFVVLILAICGLSCKPPEKATVQLSDGTIIVPGGSYRMGSNGIFETTYGKKEFPEETPVRSLTVKSFRMDLTEVTNAQFELFVKATGYVTFAERVAKPSDFPEEVRASLPAGAFHQGAIVFSKPPGSVGDLLEKDAYRSWWHWDPEANWRQPEGKESSIHDRRNHPVVCVTHEDCAAYAAWAGKRLPTEAEWEYAARGGLIEKTYCWGDELTPGGKWLANTFQGDFPAKDSAADGFSSTAPVGSFPANGYGLHDMAGNVWEICADVYGPHNAPHCSTCAMASGLEAGQAKHVIKGGSFLCHVSYCMRYRPAARQAQDDGSPANHTGFRCVRDF